jgi:hypothetical protein
MTRQPVKCELCLNRPPLHYLLHSLFCFLSIACVDPNSHTIHETFPALMVAALGSLKIR